MWKHRKGAPAPRILGLVEVSAVDEDLIGRTLKLVKTTEPWEVSRTDHADLVLVDVDRPQGRSRWWSLRRDEHLRAVVPITARRELADMQPLLLKPVGGRALSELLDHYHDVRAGIVSPSKLMRREPFLLEAIMDCPWSRFAVQLSQGGRFLLDVGQDRLYPDGDLARLRGLLFQPVDGAAIRPVATFGDQNRASDESVILPLSRWLSSAVVGARRVESLAIFRGNPVLALVDEFDLDRVPVHGDLYPVPRVLATHGPLELLELILISGCSRRGVCAALAALWVARRLSVNRSARGRAGETGQARDIPFRTGPRLAH